MSRAAANQLLDQVSCGRPAPESEILFALLVTGDLVVRPLGKPEKEVHFE